MEDTFPVFHFERSQVNSEAPSNILCMSVTCPVLQSPMALLNATAFWNMYAMFVTLEVSHPLRSSLNVEQAVLQL